nr:putative phage abortive infection protein [Paenibacillus chitinolyticus]
MTFEERLEFYLGSQYSHFEHYVNYFDWIVTFVYQNEEIDQSTKINYYHTLKAQLSSYERLILFYIVILTQNAKFAMKVVHVLSISELERKLVDVHHIDIYDQIFNKNFEVKESS